MILQHIKNWNFNILHYLQLLSYISHIKRLHPKKGPVLLTIISFSVYSIQVTAGGFITYKYLKYYSCAVSQHILGKLDRSYQYEQ